MTPPKTFSDLPSYADLPNKRQFWPWPKGSHEEALGMLNLLTPEHVANVVKNEVKTGQRIGVGWDFRKVEYPYFNRILYNLKIYKSSNQSFDDEYHFNPQQSSQWDGLRHHAQPIFDAKEGEEKQLWYGGTTEKEIQENKTGRIGIGHWAQEGICARGVLLDFASYAKEKGIKYSSMSDRQITLDELKAVAEHYKVEFQPGDVLFFRIGFIEEWNSLTEQQMIDYRNGSEAHHTGIEVNDAMLEWIWDHHFVAIATDAVSVEVYPPVDPNLSLHHYCIAGWGMPLGEIFDLDGLAKLCAEHNRYSFFFTSVPFNAFGGVSSAPNGVAMF